MALQCCTYATLCPYSYRVHLISAPCCYYSPSTSEATSEHILSFKVRLKSRFSFVTLLANLEEEKKAMTFAPHKSCFFYSVCTSRHKKKEFYPLISFSLPHLNRAAHNPHPKLSKVTSPFYIMSALGTPGLNWFSL